MYSSSPNIVPLIKQRQIRLDGRSTWRIWERGEAYTEFWWGNLKERDRLGDPGVDERIILRWTFRKWNVRVWTGSSWLKIGTGGGHL